MEGYCHSPSEDGSAIYQGLSGRNGGKLQDLECVLKVESFRSANELDVESNSKRRVKAGCRDLGLSNSKDGRVAFDVEMGSLMAESG